MNLEIFGKLLLTLLIYYHSKEESINYFQNKREKVIKIWEDQLEKIYQIIEIIESSIPRKSFYISKHQLNDILPLIDFTRIINS